MWNLNFFLAFEFFAHLGHQMRRKRALLRNVFGGSSLSYTFLLPIALYLLSIIAV
jgi:hypothetical protein